MRVDRPVGIDLGTTNSEIAILDPSERDLLVYADRFGRKTIPSAVAWHPEKGELLVGRAARNRRGKSPPPVESIKRRMGQGAKVTLGPHEMTPEEVSGAILRELAENMGQHLRDNAPSGVDVEVKRAVITVPAYFDAPQVEATRTAGELAGLEVLGVLQEPTAAAIYHTWKHRLGDGVFLVYDLGGGTFDVSILRCLGGEYQVLAIDGDNFLGGDDFDRRYAERLRRVLVDRGYRLELDVRGSAEDAERFARLVHLAQEIKESLSTADVVPVSREGILDDQEGESVDLEAEIGRGEYEEAIADLVEATLACCERALAQAMETAGVGRHDVDHVVLVGGSTRVPLVVRRVTEVLCGPARCEAPLADEVDTCVALGAAIHAAQLGGLRLADDATGAQVLLRSPLVSRKADLRLALVVEGPTTARGVAVRRGDTLLAEESFDEVPSDTLRLTVPLEDAPEQAVSLVFDSGEAAAPATMPLTLYRGDVRPRASSLSRPSVVAKDIAVEVVRAGRRERKVLVPRGASLPVEVEHRFYTGDRSGAVVLRLLQNRLPIKTLVVQVPDDLPVGAPVDLAVRCDEAMRIEARASVAGQELWASIEGAQLEPPASAAAVEGLLAEAEVVARGLWGREGQAYRRELEPLATGLREVVATDPDKAAALATRLTLLVEEFRDGSGEGLSPPMHRFEDVLDRLRRVVYRAGGPMMGMPPEEWEERIADLDRRGQEAWAEADGATWRRCYNEAQALYETATEQEFAQMRLDDPAYLQRRLLNSVAWANHVERALHDFVPASAEEVRALQVREQERLLGSLKREVTGRIDGLSVDGTKAADLRRALDQVGAELERIEHALERLPQIGLVTERGGDS